MEADEPSTQNESEKSRFIRLGVYFILYGILLELSLLAARYQLFDTKWDKLKLWFIVGVTVFFIIQIGKF